MAKSRRSMPAPVAAAAPPATEPRRLTRTLQRAGVAMRSAFGLRGKFSPKSQYEAASPSERVQHVADTGPNASVGELERIRARSRHAVRNNPHAKHALWVLISNVVGYGIKPLTPYKDLGELFEDWAEETGFYRKQALVCGTWLQSGEAIARFRARLEGDLDSVPLDVQIMEPDHLPLHNNAMTGGNTIFASIEEDLIGRIVAYHLYRDHPTDYVTGRSQTWTTSRVPASEVMHVFLQDRPGQRRGVPVFATALNTLDNLSVYDDAELERKKGAAMFGGFYRKPLDSEGSIPDAFGEIDDDGIVLQPLQPNTWLELPVGYEVDMATPPSGDANYAPFRREQLAAVAVSLHMTYEHLTWNFEKLGDRQYRAAMLEFVRLIEMFQYHVLIDLFCGPVWKRFVQTAILSGRWVPPEGARPRDYLRAQWTPPARGYVHPVQDIQAYSAAIRAGITSRKRVAGQLGEDVRQIDLENAQDQAAATELKLRYSTYVGQDADQVAMAAADTAASEALAAVVAAETEADVGRFAEAEAA
ncbi:phage portal protein [Aureimonas sp. SA4125]|uniref:phage portal protein n=1 Tax=Aureimonas sp. SA4125 TaxID=2826993 RepID=UPI001CC6E6B8|nr:phage portal protein [Aureimonas sp. SA4125]BDA85477.1 phage portal protein [Aureimonas sp. SA4125]